MAVDALDHIDFLSTPDRGIGQDVVDGEAGYTLSFHMEGMNGDQLVEVDVARLLDNNGSGEVTGADADAATDEDGNLVLEIGRLAENACPDSDYEGPQDVTLLGVDRIDAGSVSSIFFYDPGTVPVIGGDAFPV